MVHIRANENDDFFKKVQYVRETAILVEQQPPKGVFICDHAGLVISKFSQQASYLALTLLHLTFPIPVSSSSIPEFDFYYSPN